MISKFKSSHNVSMHNAQNGVSSKDVFDENVEEIADRLFHRQSQEFSSQDIRRRHSAMAYLRALFAAGRSPD